jgi:hypothetical protein
MFIIKSTFTVLEIFYSKITTYQIWLTGVPISTNGNFALCRQRVFRFLMCCRQSLLSFRMPGNINPRKGGTTRSLMFILTTTFILTHSVNFPRWKKTEPWLSGERWQAFSRESVQRGAWSDDCANKGPCYKYYFGNFEILNQNTLWLATIVVDHLHDAVLGILL